MNAVVTGAASGLGRAFAIRLARDGWCVAICDRNLAGSEETLSLVRAAGGSGRVEALDVGDPTQWASLRKRLESDWSDLDLLVNNAGVTAIGEVGQLPLDQWQRLLQINLSGVIYGCHTFVDWLKCNPRSAHIINVSSTAAFESAPGTAAYNVTKAAVLSLSESLYAELRRHRVGVTVVCPSFFKSSILSDTRYTSDRWREIFERMMADTDLTPEEVANEALAAMKKKALYVILPRQSRRNWRAKRLAPQRFLDRVAQFVNELGDKTKANA
jgi:NAD(P)-dependent dehydrogenase (short-subunit alcohol dehydrogenase family)